MATLSRQSAFNFLCNNRRLDCSEHLQLDIFEKPYTCSLYPFIHTHTHTHTHTYTHTHTHTYTYIYKYMNLKLLQHLQLDILEKPYTCFLYTFIYLYTNIYVYIYIYIYIYEVPGGAAGRTNAARKHNGVGFSF